MENRERLRAVEQAARAGEEARAWQLLAPLLDTWRSNAEAARWLASALDIEGLSRSRRLAIADELLTERGDDAILCQMLANEVEALVDMRYLNAAPPSEPFFPRLLERLSAHFDAASDEEARINAAQALASVARLSGREADALCDRVYRELLRLRPNRWQDHYNYGLFLKTRGRFDEGLRANQRAMELGGNEESVIWNLGICATGAGQGALALEHWRKHLDIKAELGRDGLPDGRYQTVKVRVAQRPFAERGPEADDPGEEETLWIDRMSPCHGTVLSAPVNEVGVEFGDVVLFDGAPITTHEVKGRKVPVFPHLATIRRGGWHVFWFTGSQRAQGEFEELSKELPGDSIVYSHTEQLVFSCQECWERGPASGHDHSRDEPKPIVSGKLCFDPTVPLAESAAALWKLLAQRPHLQLAAPDLARAVGDIDRARKEEVLLERLSSAEKLSGAP